MVTLSFEMVIFILNISIVNLFKQSNEVALFLPFSATYGVGGAPGRTANIHFQFRRFENAVYLIQILFHTILELPKLDSWEFGANLSQTLLVAVFNKNLKL